MAYKLDDRVLGTPGLWAPRTNTIPPTPPHHPPHHPHRQVLNMNSRESSIKQALEAIENGTSESKAAKDYNIPRSTLYNRRTGRTDTQHGHTNQQRLSPKQEDELCRWIIEQEARGYAPSHKRVRETAVLMLEVSGDMNHSVNDGFMLHLSRWIHAATYPSGHMRPNADTGYYINGSTAPWMLCNHSISRDSVVF